MAPVTRGNSLYTIVDGPSWTQAEAASIAIGGHLATINNVAENDFLINQKEWWGSEKSGLYIGLYETTKTTFGSAGGTGFNHVYPQGRTWRWANGESPTYLNWSLGQGGADMSVVDGPFSIISKITTPSGAWDDLPNNPSIEIPWGSQYQIGRGIAEIPITTSITFSSAPKEGEGPFTTSINLSAGNSSSGNLANGSVVYWTVSGITADDLATGSLSGSGTISDGKLAIQHSLKVDADVGEKFEVSVFSDSARSQQIGSKASINILEAITTTANTNNIRGNNSGIANNGTLTNNGSINQFSNNGPVNTGTIVSNSNNGNTINSNNNSGNTFTTNSNNGNIINSNNGNTANTVNNYYTIINSNVNSNNQTTNTNSGNIGSTIGSFNTQNTINQTYVSKNSTDYKIVRIADNRYGIKLPDSNTVDEITGQRYVPFADKAIDIQKDVKGVFDQVTGKETSDAKMFRLYNAAFARTPDADGLKFWINSYSSGAVDYKQVAQSFLSSPEFASKYGMSNSNNDFVNNLYRNILGRSPDSSGLQFWVGNLNQGINSRADVLGGFSESPENKNLFSQTTGFN